MDNRELNRKAAEMMDWPGGQMPWYGGYTIHISNLCFTNDWNPSELISQACLLPAKVDLFFKVHCGELDGVSEAHICLGDGLGDEVGAFIGRDKDLGKAMAMAITRACVAVHEHRKATGL